MIDIIIRPVDLDDIPAITAIYGAEVRAGSASFELDPPNPDEMRRRMLALTEGGFPYRVALREGTLLGYAYAGPYRPRPAYRFTVEDSIYLAPAARGLGLGRRLLAEIIAASEERGYRQMIAVIGDSANHGSIGLHRALGFQPIGIFPSIGWKHGRWIDSVLMQRPLGAGDTTPPTPG
jgi:phosphinothricin acetyltransferase